MDIHPGDLVFLTQDYEKYVFDRNPNMRISLVNRLAKLEEIIDWSSEKGKKIKDARMKSGKWKDLSIEDNKYIFSVFYPDLIGRNKQQGIIERGVPMFEKDPITGCEFFIKVPDWFSRELLKKCESFEVQDK